MSLPSGTGAGRKGFYPTSLLQAMDRGVKTQAADLSAPVKEVLLLGEFIQVREWTVGFSSMCKCFYQLELFFFELEME